MSVDPRFEYREPLKGEYPEIAKVSEDLVRCAKCGLCRAVCPTLIETVTESEGARGRVSLVEAVFDGRLSLSQIFDERISTCLNCKACVDACPSGVRVDDIILAAKAELVSRGRLSFLKRLILRGLLKRGRLLPPVGRFASILQRGLLALSPKGSALRLLLPVVRIHKNRNLPVFARQSFIEQVRNRALGSSGHPATAAGLRVAYFVGCSANLIYTNIAFSVVDVLERLGVQVLVPAGQGCCGMPVFNSGDFVTARGMGQKTVEALRASDVDAIVVSCSSCGLSLKREYSAILGIDAPDVSSKVMDVSEFIVKTVGLDRLRVALERAAGEQSAQPSALRTEGSTARRDTAQIASGQPEVGGRHRARTEKLVVTYHDPCHLRRGQGVKDEPREIIRIVPHVQYKEMRDADRCCGGAGLYSFAHYEMSRAIAEHKVESIVETGANVVLTGCASCIMQIEDALLQAGHLVKVMHVIEFLSIVLRGESPLSLSRQLLEPAACLEK